MAQHLLTAPEIKHSSKPKLRDGGGLWLHTGKTGNRHWVFIFIRNGRRREMGLGAYGSGTIKVSLAAAREKAAEIRRILGSGGDPFSEMAERRVEVRPITFGECADDYITAMADKWRNGRTELAWRNMVSVYAKALQKMPISQVQTNDVMRVLKPIWQSKTETATRTRERIKIVLDHAKVRGLRSGDNPAEWRGHLDQLLPPPKKLQRGHHAAMPYTEMPNFVLKLRAEFSVRAAALEFLILTCARSGEARGAMWDEMDLETKVWTIPATRMKEQREHRVPLSDRAVELLGIMRRRSDSTLVFPGQKPGKPLTDMGLSSVLKTMGTSNVTVHGFRSSFRDWVGEATEYQREIAEAALAHAVGDAVERAYRRGDMLTKRRAMMDAWAQYLASCRNF